MFESFESSALIVSVIAGIFIGIPTGPAQFFVVDTCVNEGKIAGLKVYGGLVTVKLLYAALAVLTSNLLAVNKKVESIVSVIAAFLLIVWGVIIIVKSNKDSDKESNTSIQLNIKSLFKKGFVVGISNPAIPFVYLTLVQIIRAYTNNVLPLNYIMNILAFEAVSFITLAIVALLLLTRKRQILNHWNRVKLVMGIFIACIGAYQVYQHVEFDNGIKIKNSQNALEKQLDNAEK